jgi:hypothetical protein
MVVDSQIMKNARELFSLGTFHGEDELLISFECLGAELWTRALIARQVGEGFPESQRNADLASAFRYQSLRLSVLLARTWQIEWMKENVSASRKTDSGLWTVFAALAIKDFHIDISSVMDSIAPVVIQAKGSIKKKDTKKLPGFPDIQSGTRRSYREKIPEDILTAIDSSVRWWPTVKRIRDILTHRDHNKIVFGTPADGVLFQIYEDMHEPKIIEPNFLWPGGKNVVDFELYAAFVIGEVLVLLDKLGKQIAFHLGFEEEGLTKSIRTGNFRGLVRSLDRLLELTA